MYAALVPPPTVLEDLAAVVRSVPGGAAELEPVPVDLMYLPLGNFGNVGLSDRIALESALRDEVARWAPMELRLHGGSALVEPGDDSVWVGFAGDVAQLTAMGNIVPRAVQRLGFLIDRRSFRTRLRIGRITPYTEVAYLERLLDRLDSYVGPAWTAHHVALLRRMSGVDEGESGLDVMHQLRLVGDDAAGDAGDGRHRSPDEASHVPADR